MLVFAKIFKGKLRPETSHILLKIALIKHSFARTLTTVGFRHRMLSAKLLLVFGVDILLDTNTSNTGILIATELTNEDFIRIMHIVLYQNK